MMSLQLVRIYDFGILITVDEASEVRVQAKVADLIVKLKEGLNVWQTWRLMVLLRGVEGRSFGEMF